MIVHEDLLRMIAEEKKPTFISTGLTSYEDFDKAIEIFKKAGCPLN